MASALLVVLAACMLAGAQAATWSVFAHNLITESTGIAFDADGQTGYLVGDGNGAGPEILKTTDGGVTWNPVETSFGIDVLLLAVAAAEPSVVVTSVFGELYSVDGGNTFNHTTGGGISQSARFLSSDGDKGTKYGVTGQYGKVQGVGISVDGGKTIKAYDAKLFTEARYGAFPTDTTWYCAAGEWPNNNGNTRRRFELQDETGRWPKHVTLPKPSNDVGYAAQITKSTDGGNTWTTVFANNGSFYFNGIDCNPANENHCCACAEGFGSVDPGARVYCTWDGGRTWNRTGWFPQGTKGYSLMEIRFTSDTDIWAAGGVMGGIGSAMFIHSTDGGATWEIEGGQNIPGSLAISIAFPSTGLGYAVVDNTITQATSVAKYS